MNLLRPTTLVLLAMATMPGFADQPELGRLFLDPQQRQKLDIQRQRNPNFLPNAGAEEASQTINGEVRSSNGRRTRWINGAANWDGTTPPPRVPVGDTFNPSTGEREDLLRGGRIEIKSSR